MQHHEIKMDTEQSTLPPQALVFTEHAAEKVKELSTRQDNPGSMLRVYIQGGGCSGFQYGFALEGAENEDDMVVETDGVKLLVDPMSFQYLMGAEIDYLEDLQGARFVINNPNATTTCGCGSSFGI
jgi:iron-sulfur cluster insertion protein